MLLEECRYVVKEKRSLHIIEDIEICSDEPDKQNFDEGNFDKEDFDKQDFDEET